MERPATVPGAGTARLRTLLAGPARTGRVLHAGADAVYVDLADRVVGVLSAHAVHVPCGLRTTLPALPAVAPGATVSADGGVLAVGPLRVHLARLVDATAPRFRGSAPARLTPQPAERRPTRELAAERWLRCELASLETTAAARAELPADALDALRAGDPAAVGRLLGRGSGLTPLGDDVLAGWLATARLADPAYPTVAAEVGRLAAARTTRLSAELLACAREGEVIPEFARLLRALSTDRGAHDALRALLGVGHTSGAGLALGALLALQGATGHQEAA